MCRSPLHSFLVCLPKCEHHMHLEGALDTSLLFELASKNNIKLPVDTNPEFASPDALLARYDKFASLDDFLHFYYIGMSVLLHPSDFEALAWSYFQRAKSGNIVHAELFFDPQAHTSRGVPYRSVVDGFNAARARAERELGLSSMLIVCFLRHLPVPDAMMTYMTAVPDLESGALAGIGLDSSEAEFPPGLFVPVYEKARERGFRRTAHAGEECGPESVRDALRLLHVERIDHGRTIVEDEELLREVAERKILVTMCPLSNVCLRGVERVEQVPIRKFLDAGVRFSINSDDPAYFGGYVQENYCAVQEAFGLNIEEWVRIAEGAIEGSWCTVERKEELKGLLAKVKDDYGLRA